MDNSINYIRLLHVHYSICEKLSHKLSRSYFFELLKTDNDLEHSFYEQQTQLENRTVYK